MAKHGEGVVNAALKPAGNRTPLMRGKPTPARGKAKSSKRK